MADTEADALVAALKPCGLSDPNQARIIRIKNTLTLDEMWGSAPIAAELNGKAHVEIDELTPQPPLLQREGE